MSKLLPVLSFLLLLLAGCLGRSGSAPLPETFTPATPSLTATQTLIPSTLTATAVPTSTETMPPTSTPPPAGMMTSTSEPIGCKEPPDDYTRAEINGRTLNRRTLAMLAHARDLYGGELEIAGYAITQGSYTNAVSASFGTHQGGGAVDLSVMRRDTYTVLWDDVGPLLHALRVAGFAAWLRDYGELHADSPIHIHAIAIGDRELSSAAEEQLTGPAGYFRGYSGLPLETYGAPTPDRFGGPILCQWMIELGYQDLR